MGDSPGTHALIIGISDYKHLPSFGQSAAPRGKADQLSLGLTQQTIAARTAQHFYNWLVKRKDRLVAPLATCRLMLAPSDEEIMEQPEIEKLKTTCTMEDFLVQANAWRQDASARKEDTTIFYFAGNGFEVEKSDPVLRSGDFGNGVGPVLRSAFRVDDLFRGMGPAHWQPDIARTQLYFVDTDRNPLGMVSASMRRGTTLPFDVEQPGIDDRGAVIFYASTPGSPAYGVKGEGLTYFLMGLILSLEGAAAIPGSIDELGRQHWQISIKSLVQNLGPMVKDLTAQAGVKQEVTLSGLVKDAVICFLDGPPKILLRLEIEPPAAAAKARIEVRDTEDELVDIPPLEGNPPVLETALLAGYYRIKILFDSTDSAFRNHQFMQLLMPPMAVLKIKVAQ